MVFCDCFLPPLDLKLLLKRNRLARDAVKYFISLSFRLLLGNQTHCTILYFSALIFDLVVNLLRSYPREKQGFAPGLAHLELFYTLFC